MTSTPEQNPVSFDPASPGASPRTLKAIAIFWPSFLTAGLATIFCFSAFDPEMMLHHTYFANASRLGTYTTGFFSFWVLTASSCALTCYFQRPCAVINSKSANLKIDAEEPVKCNT